MSDKTLRELEEAVTPGRWHYTRSGDALYLNRGDYGIASAIYHDTAEAEFALIVRMRNALGEALHGEAYRD